MLIGSHVGMKGKDMFLGSVKEALSYGANTFMVYTGAPQNTRRKKIEELRIEDGTKLMKEHGMETFVVHAPYIINLANTTKPETFELAVEFLEVEVERTKAMGSHTLVLHPGSHVGAGVDKGIDRIIEGLNQVMYQDMPVHIALETMAGKGSEIGREFEELKRIYDGVKYPEKLRVCFDTCHVSDSGLDLSGEGFENVIDQFDKTIGKDQIAVFHINDSKNVIGAGKDRHENLGFGTIGFETLNHIVHHKDFEQVPKILETPYIKAEDSKKGYKLYMNQIKPMLLTTLKSYDRSQFVKDVTAGIIVAIIALPLSIALALASGVGPQAGIFTAIVAGFVISAFGGSSVQIAGPTAAFATIVAGIVAKDGLDGLVISTILAGIFLILMGLCHFGSLIKFIPYTITTGFTSGIAVTIVIGQLKDFFGVTYPNGLKPIETMEKLNAFALGFSSFHVDALIVGGVSLAILIIIPYTCSQIFYGEIIDSKCIYHCGTCCH